MRWFAANQPITAAIAAALTARAALRDLTDLAAPM